MADPASVSALDSQYSRRHLQRSMWLPAAGVIGVIIIVLCFLGVIVLSQQAEIASQHQQIARQLAQIGEQERQLQSSCGFYRLIATLDPQPAGSVRPGTTGVTLIVDARDTYIGQGCGPLPPPVPDLVHWAGYYHVPLVK